MRRTLVITVGFYAACSLGLGAVSQWLTSTAAEHTGLIQSFYTQTGSVDVAPVRRRVREIDLSLLEQFPDTLRRFFRVEWEGVWYVPENTTVDLDAGADDRVRVTVDGDLVIEYDITRNVDTGPRRLVLSRGFHDLVWCV